MTKIYAILNKQSQEFQTYNGRCAWTKRGNAVNSFNQNRPVLDRKQFEDYEKHGLYEIVELTHYYHTVESLEELK